MKRVVIVLCIGLHLVLGFSRNVDVFEGGVCNETNGKQWYCKKLGDCPYPLKVLEDESKEPPFCKFDRHQREPVVCCDPSLTLRKSEQMCVKYGEHVTVRDCSLGDIHSLNAPPKGYPHIASIGFKNSSAISWPCTGSLISDRYVLSVAPCIQREKPIWVRLGDYDRGSQNDEEGLSHPVVYEVSEVITHPDLNVPSFYNNVALLKLNDTVQFNKFIRPICLQTEYELDSQYVIGLGFGRKSQGAKPNTILQQVNMTVVPWNECNDNYKIFTDVLENGVKDESMFCTKETAKRTQGGVLDVCMVENGSPVIQRVYRRSCMYSLIGIATFSARCITGEVPGLYTRISHFIPWIESVVWP